MTRLPMNGIRQSTVLALSLIVLLFGCAAGLSDSQANRETGSRDVELIIQERTLAIRSGRLSKENLAIAYLGRANAYQDKKDYDRAIKDYDEAIRLNPNYGDAYNNRGLTYKSKKEFDRAIEDFNEAIRLNPKDD